MRIKGLSSSSSGRRCEASANARLRSCNPVTSLNRQTQLVLPVCDAQPLMQEQSSRRGVSSFGYSGIIAHARLRVEETVRPVQNSRQQQQGAVQSVSLSCKALNLRVVTEEDALVAVVRSTRKRDRGECEAARALSVWKGAAHPLLQLRFVSGQGHATTVEWSTLATSVVDSCCALEMALCVATKERPNAQELVNAELALAGPLDCASSSSTRGCCLVRCRLEGCDLELFLGDQVLLTATVQVGDSQQLSKRPALAFPKQIEKTKTKPKAWRELCCAEETALLTVDKAWAREGKALAVASRGGLLGGLRAVEQLASQLRGDAMRWFVVKAQSVLLIQGQLCGEDNDTPAHANFSESSAACGAVWARVNTGTGLSKPRLCMGNAECGLDQVVAVRRFEARPLRVARSAAKVATLYDLATVWDTTQTEPAPAPRRVTVLTRVRRTVPGAVCTPQRPLRLLPDGTAMLLPPGS